MTWFHARWPVNCTAGRGCGSGGVVNYDCGKITNLFLIDISTNISTAWSCRRAVLKTGTAVDLP